MKIVFPDEMSKRDLHQFMLGSVIPRPIAFVSTVSNNGVNNLAPFSYFNAISSLPPILAFSMSRRPDGSKKDTHANLIDNGECVIHMVNFETCHKMAIAGVDFPPDTDEFIKCGLTQADSQMVKPRAIAEAPVRFECKLDRIIELGNIQSPTSLAIVDVLCIHYNERIMSNKNRIIPEMLDPVGRLGRTNYLRFNEENVFSIALSRKELPIGFDNLPRSILISKILSGNDIAQIAGLTELPSAELIDDQYKKFGSAQQEIDTLHEIAQKEIILGNIEIAAAILLIPEYYDL
jgi:flavin reductase (DIM6/NTAB) family NADH-FMN oxidoreductase RutF